MKALASYEREFLLCELCPRMCRHACPVGVVARDEALTAQEKMGEARRQLRGASKPGVFTAWDCTGCGLCTETCEHDNPVAALLFQARAERFAAGDAPVAALQLARRMRAQGTPGAQALETDLLESVLPERRVRSKVASFEGPAVPGRGLRVLFPGCTLLEDAPDRVAELLQIADALGEGDLVVWDGKEGCCGYPLLAAGDLQGFKAQARKLASALEGAALLTTPCAHCAFTLEKAWAQVGVKAPPVEHLGRTLLRALRRAGPRAPLPGERALHEPCHLAGLEGGGRENTELLALIEGRVPAAASAPGAPQARQDDGPAGADADRNGQKPSVWRGARTFCCGGGGAMPFTRPELSREMALVRAADLAQESHGVPGLPVQRARAADGKRVSVISASPCCARSFREAGVESEDLFDLLGRFLLMKEGEER